MYEMQTEYISIAQNENKSDVSCSLCSELHSLTSHGNNTPNLLEGINKQETEELRCNC